MQMGFIHFLKFFSRLLIFVTVMAPYIPAIYSDVNFFSARCQMGWSIASASKLSEDVDNSEVSHDPIKLISRSKYDGSGDC